MIIARTSLLKFAPHASPAIVEGICDHSRSVLPKWNFTSQQRVQMLLAHIKVESAGLTTLTENLNYTSADRIGAVFGHTHFATEVDAVPYVHNPQALANRVYGGRMGNAGPDDGWLNRGQGLLQVTGQTNMAALAKLLGVTVVQVRAMLVSSASMLECACAIFTLNGAMAAADAGDILLATKKIQGGTGGLADRQAAYLLAQQIWPSASAAHAVALPTKPPPPKSQPVKGTAMPPVPARVSTPTSSYQPTLLDRLISWVTAVTGCLLIVVLVIASSAPASAETLDFAPLVNAAITNILIPLFFTVATLVTGVLGLYAQKWMSQASAKIFQDRLNVLLTNGINFGADQVKQFSDRQDYTANVDGWIAAYAAKYANDHAPDLTKQAGNVVEKIVARIGDNTNAQIAKSLAGQPAATPVLAAPVAVATGPQPPTL